MVLSNRSFRDATAFPNSLSTSASGQIQDKGCALAIVRRIEVSGLVHQLIRRFCGQRFILSDADSHFKGVGKIARGGIFCVPTRPQTQADCGRQRYSVCRSARRPQNLRGKHAVLFVPTAPSFWRLSTSFPIHHGITVEASRVELHIPVGACWHRRSLRASDRPRLCRSQTRVRRHVSRKSMGHLAGGVLVFLGHVGEHTAQRRTRSTALPPLKTLSRAFFNSGSALCAACFLALPGPFSFDRSRFRRGDGIPFLMDNIGNA